MSDDNVNQESLLPFRPRTSTGDPISDSGAFEPQASTPAEPDFDPDSPRRSNIPLVSDDGSPMGSSITNRAHHSGSYTFSHNRPSSAGAVPNDFGSDALSEQGADFASPTPSRTHRQLWKGRAAHSASPDRPMSRTAAENRMGRSTFGDSDTHPAKVPRHRFSTGSAGDESGPSRIHHPMVRSSPISNDGAGPSHQPTRPPEGPLAPRRSRESRESLSYGQESARGLSNEQKSAGGFSAVAGGTASHGTFLQPETHPITEEQLINEVRGIYAGLVMVEKKCIEIDKQQSESKTNLTDQQWQALIALHRTLLQEHHDFFMASQHPTASPVLRRLAEKYAMPARMWRYGIHSFLELLRHRLPDSLDHMLTFIYLAYSMMTLLLETVSAFQETWIECLGDLSRYRMAVEDYDLKEREVWAGVARYWYNKAADRNPDVGRIQHHLAVLSRPYILQQLFFYTKSLVTVRSFSGTRESILLLFNPLLQGPTRPSNHPPLITAFVSAHGALFNRDTSSRFITSTNDFLTPLDKFITRVGPAFRMQGVHIVSSSIAAMLEYGHPSAGLPIEFQQGSTQQPKSLEDIYQVASRDWTPTRDPQKVMSDFQALGDPESPSRFAFYGSCLMFEALSIFLDQNGDQNVFPAFNVSLSFLWCLARTTNGMKYAEAIVPWSKIVSCLNTMIRPWLEMQYAEQDDFPVSNDTKWTPEDFFVRGQIWNQGYYPDDFFDDAPTEDEGRNIELPSLSLFRIYRCLWLGVRLAKFDRWFTYQSGPETRGFSATPFALELEKLSQAHKPFTPVAEGERSRSDVPMQGS